MNMRRIAGITSSRLRGIVNSRLVRLGSSPAYELSETLVTAGHPRSGTTWLAELVATLPGSAILFEPLNPYEVKEVAASGIGLRPLRQPGERWPEGEQFFARVLRGAVVNSWTVSQVPLRRAWKVERWVVKMVRANRCLGWLAERFPVRPPVLLIRHPCAVLASRLSRGWPPPGGIVGREAFVRRFPHLQPVLARLRTREEYITAAWCMDYYSALSLPPPHPFWLMTFERLVTSGEEELGRLFSAWGLDTPQEAIENLGRASAKASDHFYRDRSRLLNRWRDELDGKQVRQVLDVVSSFGLDFYDGSPEPDYARLEAMRPLTTAGARHCHWKAG